MSKQFYLVIQQTDDGLHIDKRTKEEIEEALNSGDLAEPLLDGFPKFYDGFFDNKGTIILKAEQVFPKPVEKITRYEL